MAWMNGAALGCSALAPFGNTVGFRGMLTEERGAALLPTAGRGTFPFHNDFVTAS